MEGKRAQERNKTTHSHMQESHKNTKLEVVIHTQKAHNVKKKNREVKMKAWYDMMRQGPSKNAICFLSAIDCWAHSLDLRVLCSPVRLPWKKFNVHFKLRLSIQAIFWVRDGVCPLLFSVLRHHLGLCEFNLFISLVLEPCSWVFSILSESYNLSASTVGGGAL